MAITLNWKHQLNILWLGQAILMIVMVMSLPYWPLYLATLDHFSAVSLHYWSAAIYVAPFITSTFAAPLWGRWGDKFGYKPMVIRATLGLFITQTLILFCSRVELILFIRLLQGVLAGFIVAAQAWALSISPENERGATIGKLQSATAIGNLMGPLIGGLIATYCGYHAIFSISSISCILVAIVFFFVLHDVVSMPTSAEQSTTDNKKTELNFWQKNILSILVVITVMQLGRAMITPIFALFVTEQLGGNDITIGILYAATGLMVFITAPRWGKFFDQIYHQEEYLQKVIVALLFISAILQVLHIFAASTISIFILRLLWGICLGALLPILLRLLADQASDHAHGMFLGYGDSANKIGNLLGMIIGAMISAHLGYASTFLLIASFYILSGLIFMLGMRPTLARTYS